MGLLDELHQFGDAVVGHAAREDVGGGERRQHRPPSGRATLDRETVGVGQARVGEAADGRDGVLDVDDAPLSAQPITVLAPEAAGPAVVDVDDADAPAGEVGVHQMHRGRDMRGGATVHERDVRRQFPLGCNEVRVARGVDERMDLAFGALEGECLRFRRYSTSGRSSTDSRTSVSVPTPRSSSRRPEATRAPPQRNRIRRPSVSQICTDEMSSSSMSRSAPVAGSSNASVSVPTVRVVRTVPASSSTCHTAPNCHRGAPKSASMGGPARPHRTD